jgi:hypothetical protein
VLVGKVDNASPLLLLFRECLEPVGALLSTSREDCFPLRGNLCRRPSNVPKIIGVKLQFGPHTWLTF